MNTCQRTGKPIVELSHSGLNTFASCPKKFAFRKMITTFKEDWEDSDATAAGTAIHAGIQEYLISQDKQRALEAMALAHHIELKNTSKASEYSLEACTWTMLKFFESDKLSGYELATFVKDGVAIPAVEIAFLVEVEFPDLVFHLRGFMDLVLKSLYSDRFMVTDIKTTTTYGKALFEHKYRWDWQGTSYGIPLNALLGHTGEFDIAFLGVFLSDREPEFTMPTYHRSTRDVEAYQFYLLDKCAAIARYYRADHFPRHPQACTSYNKLCHHHAHCAEETLKGMQLAVNPSMKTGAPPRPFDPVFTVKLEGY